MADDAAAAAIAVEDAAAQIIRPRGELFVTGEDHLRLMVVNALVGVVLTLAGRTWDPTRRVIVPFLRTIAPTADRTANELRIPLAAGFVLDLTVYASTGAPVSGQTYVMVHLVRGLEANAVQLATLASDYATSMQCVCWPGSAPKSSTEGEPYIRAITGTTPAAGNDLLETVPAGARWELLALRALLSTSGVAGTRSIVGQFTSGGKLVAEAISQYGTAPAAFASETFAANVVSAQSTNLVRRMDPIPSPLILGAGSTIATLTLGIDAADQWTQPALLVREWLEVP